MAWKHCTVWALPLRLLRPPQLPLAFAVWSGSASCSSYTLPVGTLADRTICRRRCRRCRFLCPRRKIPARQLPLHGRVFSTWSMTLLVVFWNGCCYCWHWRCCCEVFRRRKSQNQFVWPWTYNFLWGTGGIIAGIGTTTQAIHLCFQRNKTHGKKTGITKVWHSDQDFDRTSVVRKSILSGGGGCWWFACAIAHDCRDFGHGCSECRYNRWLFISGK